MHENSKKSCVNVNIELKIINKIYINQVFIQVFRIESNNCVCLVI